MNRTLPEATTATRSCSNRVLVILTLADMPLLPLKSSTFRQHRTIILPHLLLSTITMMVNGMSTNPYSYASPLISNHFPSAVICLTRHLQPSAHSEARLCYDQGQST